MEKTREFALSCLFERISSYEQTLMGLGKGSSNRFVEGVFLCA